MKTSESILKIAPALLKAQKAIGSAKKGSNNPFFHTTYADLGAVMEACKDALNENGITILQPVGMDGSGQYVETILLHESGEYISDRMMLVVKEGNNPQAQGSGITYARRYALQSMVFIPAEDDDGNSATKHQTKPKTDDLASEKQVKLIAMLLGQKGYSDEQLKAKYQVESKKELTKIQASEIIDNLNKLPDKE